MLEAAMAKRAEMEAFRTGAAPPQHHPPPRGGKQLPVFPEIYSLNIADFDEEQYPPRERNYEEPNGLQDFILEHFQALVNSLISQNTTSRRPSDASATIRRERACRRRTTHTTRTWCRSPTAARF